MIEHFVICLKHKQIQKPTDESSRGNVYRMLGKEIEEGKHAFLLTTGECKLCRDGVESKVQ